MKKYIPIGIACALTAADVGVAAASPARHMKRVTVPPLTPTLRVAPKYPTAAKDSGTGGRVTSCFTVNPDGSLSNIHILKANFWTNTGSPPTTNDELAIDDAEISALKQWRYEPRHVNGKPVATPNVCQTITFQLSR